MESKSSIIEGYQLIQQIGKGAFGTVVKARRINEVSSQKQQLMVLNVQRAQLQQNTSCLQQDLYAIKIENINIVKPMLHIEYQIYKQLIQLKQQNRSYYGYGFSDVYLYKQSDYFSYMVMDLYAVSLQDFANKQLANRLSKDMLIRIFHSILSIVQQIHQIGFLHRDIKPSNFMLKAINNKIKKNIQNNQLNFAKTIQKYQPKIYPIDLGLCKKYYKNNSNIHIPMKENKKMVGTTLFCSLNTHRGIEQSRRDDIQSIVYMVSYLVKRLPWQKVANKFQEVKRQSPSKRARQTPQSPTKIFKKQQKIQKLTIYEQIYQIKSQTDMPTFLNDPLLPQCFSQILKYAYNLHFEERPDYELIKRLLQKDYDKICNVKQKLQDAPCYWTQNLKKSVNEQQNCSADLSNNNMAKKIKINFKIPDKKLKNAQKQKLTSGANVNAKCEEQIKT